MGYAVGLVCVAVGGAVSLRWRARGGALLCGAKHDALEDDTYIDDNLHYQLAVELKVVIPQDDEQESGIWHWINELEVPPEGKK